MKLLFVPVALLSALVIAESKPQAIPVAVRTTQRPTTGVPGLDLNGKMFTLESYHYPTVTLYHPSFPISSWSLTRKTRLEKNDSSSTDTQSYAAPAYAPLTRASPITGVSVCLRYMIDYLEDEYPTIFTLSGFSTDLKLSENSNAPYMTVNFGSTALDLEPNIRFWSNILPSPWTSVCLTIDSNRSVIQLFKGPFMSIRKVIYQYDWSGQPVVEFSRATGQVKDVQVWNYPLHYREINHYMTGNPSRQGNALSWSYIRYSLQRQSFLEDSYELMAKQDQEQQSVEEDA